MGSRESRRGKRSKCQPRDKSEFSAVLRAIGEDIQRRNFEGGLSRVNRELISSKKTPHQRSRLLSMVADSEFKRGRFEESARIQLQAASENLDHVSQWLRPHVGQVRSFLKAAQVDQAVMMAHQAIALAETKQAQFEHQVRTADKMIRAHRKPTEIPPVPPRISVVATRLGYLFLQEGEIEEAAIFFQRAVDASKGGSNRARQALAQIALLKGAPGVAFRVAADAIRRGRYRVKTLSAWRILIAARRQLGGWKISERLLRGLSIAPASVRARAILIIVQELRKSGMRQWREIAETWSIREGAQFPIIEAEIRKLVVSSAKIEGESPAMRAERVAQLLQMSNLSAKEWLTGAKEWVKSNLSDGHPIDFQALLDTAERLYGEKFIPRLRHSLALSCVGVNRDDLARPLLEANICDDALPRRQWGQSVWSLAQLEALAGNHTIAAGLYRRCADEPSIITPFRLQAQLHWCQELMEAGQATPLEEARTLMEQTLQHVQDADILMNFARQLQLGPENLQEWSRELFAQGEVLALREFEIAGHPSVAVKGLFKLARRQLYDFDRPAKALQLWESLSAEKRDWLWSAQSCFWEYMGLIFDAYLRAGGPSEGETFALSLLEDPATPAEGLVYVGMPYGQWLIQERRVVEALQIFSRLIQAAPSHFLCADAYYWRALEAYKGGQMEEVKNCVERIRLAQSGKATQFSDWDPYAKTLILLADLDIQTVACQIAADKSPRLHYLKATVVEELGMLP